MIRVLNVEYKVEFNADISPEFTRDVVLKGTDGRIQKAPLVPKERSVRFAGPFPEKMSREAGASRPGSQAGAWEPARKQQRGIIP